MAEIRIHKIIRKYNIGLANLVEFLKSKGADIEENPNAKVSDEYLPAIEKQFGKDLEMKEASEKQAELEAKIERLEARLERELEWKPWTDENAFSQERYDALKKSGHEMTDDEAKRWIADEFGFDYNKIQINRKMNTYEVNRHHQLRKSGEIDRAPYYDATDWYYIYFTVCGMDYEAHSGSFRSI